MPSGQYPREAFVVPVLAVICWQDLDESLQKNPLAQKPGPEFTVVLLPGQAPTAPVLMVLPSGQRVVVLDLQVFVAESKKNPEPHETPVFDVPAELVGQDPAAPVLIVMPSEQYETPEDVPEDLHPLIP